MVAFGTVALFMCATYPAELAVAPSANFKMVLKVQAASAAVSGLPSTTSRSAAVEKVQVRPSGEVFQLRAKSGTTFSAGVYWTSSG